MIDIDTDTTAIDEAESPIIKPTKMIYPEVKEYLELDDLPRPSAPKYHNSELPPPLPKRPAKMFNKTTAAAGLAVILTSSLAKACDITSYVSSENKIYMDEYLITLNTGLYHMAAGQTMCLKYPDGKIDKIVIHATETLDIYTPIYRTANFSLDVETVWRCYYVGSCDYGGCLRGTKHSTWKKDKPLTGAITEYGCMQSNDYCSHCTFNGQCKWYKMVLKPVGSLYTVYRRIKIEWSVKASYISSDGTITAMRFSPKQIILTSPSGTKVSLLSPSRSEFFHNQYLLESPEGSVWNVHASNLGDMSSSIIGDLQIGLFDSQEIAYQMNDVSCSSRDCMVSCKTAESGLLRGLRQYYNYNAEKQTYNRVVRRQEYMSFGMFVTTKYDTSLIVVPAACSFKLEMTYGCVVCTKQPYAIIQATEIRSMGLVDITSNCTLDRTRLACQESPQLIIIDDHNSVCELTIAKSNQTLIIGVDYVFEGKVYGVVGLTSTSKTLSASEMALQFISSKSFITSLTSMMGSVTLIGISMLLIRSLMKYLVIRESVKNVKDIKDLS